MSVTSSSRARHATPAPAPKRRDDVRADIQGLRAIAVASVMLYHLWPNRLTGGYVGVDVFFAISGFLITSHLLGEIDATGTLRPTRFWMRRAKRLVPASTLVLLLTAIGIVVWVPRFLWRQFLDEVMASTVQAENWLLAHNSVDYLAAGNAASPTQHFWTLSVEEQFYLALPLLLIAATYVAAAVRVHRRRIIVGGLVATLIASLTYSVVLTSSTPGVAYFSTFTRAWEFAAGALLAVVGSSQRRHAVLPWIGIAGIAVACIGFDAKTAFPGYAAALPVGAAVLVIWSARGSLFDRFGALPPVALLGRVSYAAYLWHWPMVVLVPYITHRPLGTADKFAIIGTTVLVAWLSTTFVEDPIRFRPNLLGARRPLTVALWSAAAMSIVLAFAATEVHAQASRDTKGTAIARKLVSNMPKCFGAQSLDPAFAPCVNAALDGVLAPDPAQAKSDDANMAACWGSTSHGPKVCALGPATGYSKRLFAVGDSHNNTLIGVYRQIADDNNWRIDVAGNAGCYLTTATQQQLTASQWRGCLSWRADALKIAQTGGYDAIIVTHSDRDRQVVPGPGQTVEEATVQGLAAEWRNLPDVPIIAIRDNPSMPDGFLACVDENRSTAGVDCAVPRSEALANPDGQAEAATLVQAVRRVTVVDLTSLYCTARVCAPVVGHVLVYRDPSHITATYALTLAPYIERAVVAALSH